MSVPATCEFSSTIERLLSGEVPPREESRLAQHLESCAVCQATFERLASDPRLIGAGSQSSAGPATETALRRVIAALEKTLPDAPAPGPGHDKPSAGQHEDVSLDFLSPPDDPSHLGRLGHYEVLEVVGHGGLGVVLKGYDTKLKRVVAIKVPLSELAANAAARKRFAREAQAAAAVSHDHVVTIHAVDEDARPPFLVMEYIDGVSLQEKLDAQGPLELKEMLRIGMQIARGLAAAHEQGLVHRDIKPANVLLENGVQRVKITDFGLARAVDDVGTTQSGTVAGTPTYMSPEQARGEPVDHRSDLFSLGCVLYAMCTGRPPFRAESALAVLRRVCEDTPKPIRKVNAEVPEWLCEIVDRLLEKEPQDRFQSAKDVADLLARHLAHLQQPHVHPQPARVAARAATGAPARSSTLFDRWRQWRRQRRSPLLDAAVAMVVVLLVLVIFAGVNELVGLRKTIEWLSGKTGQITLEVSGPQVEVVHDGEKIAVTDSGRATLFVVPGDYELVSKAQGETISVTWHDIGRKVHHTVTIPDRADAVLVRGPLSGNEKAERFLRAALAGRNERPVRKPPSSVGAHRDSDAHDLRNSLDMTLRLVPAGEFEMGTPRDALDEPLADPAWFFSDWVAERRQAETPQHRVRITRPFYIGAHEVTVGQFRQFVESAGYRTRAETDPQGGFGFVDGEWIRSRAFHWQDPGFPQDDDEPVCNVAWEDAVAFCEWLSEKEQSTYRLPTEAEWEYACRAGTTTLYHSGDDPATLQDVANIADRSLSRAAPGITWAITWDDAFPFTAPAGSFQPNALGLYDMHGNAWEWCADVYDREFYRTSPADDPLNRERDGDHVFRGGGFDNWAGFARSADRYSSHSPTLRTEWAGFRVVRAVEQQSIDR
jgi:serine/threonine-protein kinase